MKYSTKNVMVVVLIVMSTITIDTWWAYNLESSARTQARYNLEQIKACVNDLTVEGTNVELEKTLKTCARKSRVSPTGDVFAYDIGSREFVFDPSLDCFVEGGKFMTAESECTLHSDPKQCRQALIVLGRGYDSDEHTRLSWKFDDSEEYLEFKILPEEMVGFKGSVRGSSTKKPHQLVVVQGVQEDEIRDRYAGFRSLVYAIGFMSIILNLAIAVHTPNYGRRRDDR